MPEPQAIAAPAANDSSSGSGTSVLAGTFRVFRVAAMGVVAVDLDRHLLAELLPAGAAMIALGAALIVMHHHALADRAPPRGSTAEPTATTTPQGSWPAMTGSGFGGKPRRLARLALRAAILVQVAAAHAGRLHLDHDLVRTRASDRGTASVPVRVRR